MKKAILFAGMCFFVSTILFSQTYKLEKVFGDKVTETYLSHWRVLEGPQDSGDDVFSLWGYKLYGESWANNTYEVEYYKGNAREVFQFLKAINEFTEKYKNEENVLTFIAGVKVKTFKQLGFKYTLVFDKERKVPCMFNQKQWAGMRDAFNAYCEDHGIEYI